MEFRTKNLEYEIPIKALGILISDLGIGNFKHEIWNSELGIRNPEQGIWNSKLRTWNMKFQTRNIKSRTQTLGIWFPNIHSLSTAYPIYTRVTGSLCLSQASLGIKAGYTLDGVPTHRRADILSFTHYGQFRDANQPTMHVFGLGEETGVSGGNPQGMRRTCKFHTHGGGRNRTPNPGGKGRELADMMERRKVDILCVQDIRWKGSKARSIGAGFKLFYYGVDSKRNGVGVVLKEEFVRNVLEVGCELEEKERFWSELDEVMESIPTGERVAIGADFNVHVGEGNRGDEEVMGKFGVKERNLEGQMVVDFAKRMDMGVVNTYFQKREEHRVTYKSGDLEKAYDRLPREELWYCMRKSGVAEKYVRVVQDMYERSRTVVRCAVGQTEEFKVEVGLHQGSALSPFLFAIVMDQLSEEVRQESPWTMMFADDIVICSESREQVEANL
ncbi:hypothetical protein QTP70_018018 [Hemibagrus guttatus]|uniref:Reverse transcriptase domain-containing protein n=1 Tax=Hemibagrus guttatus TaxID=175788 RepID=A0AAE0PVW8_9TELE|nr:hypothetical protein QTP70_018018 [Hemibagrus guttatus]